MKESYPTMTEALSVASNLIADKTAGAFWGNRLQLTEEQKDQWVEAMGSLRTTLIQLNNMVNTDYAFDQGLTGDIKAYSKLMEKHHQPIEELVGFQLSRSKSFPADTMVKYETAHLEEVLIAITKYSNTISRILAEA